METVFNVLFVIAFCALLGVLFNGVKKVKNGEEVFESNLGCVARIVIAVICVGIILIYFWIKE